MISSLVVMMAAMMMVNSVAGGGAAAHVSMMRFGHFAGLFPVFTCCSIAMEIPTSARLTPVGHANLGMMQRKIRLTWPCNKQ
jgi:hypothetical protein